MRVRWPKNGEMLESEGLLENNQPNEHLLKLVFGVAQGGRIK